MIKKWSNQHQAEPREKREFMSLLHFISFSSEKTPDLLAKLWKSHFGLDPTQGRFVLPVASFWSKLVYVLTRANEITSYLITITTLRDSSVTISPEPTRKSRRSGSLSSLFSWENISEYVGPSIFFKCGFISKIRSRCHFFIKNIHRKNVLMVYSDFLARNQISIE